MRIHISPERRILFRAPKKGAVLDLNQFDAMLPRYCKGRGWDQDTTKPRESKLEEMGLDFI